jgi:TRAP-type C4-dicarboxylate transport system permease small subunit
MTKENIEPPQDVGSDSRKEASRFFPRRLSARGLWMRRRGLASKAIFVAEASIAILCLGALTVVPAYQILARAVPVLPLPLWSYDVAALFLVWLAFIGAAMAERSQTPPVVTIVTDVLPLRVQGALSVLGAVLSISVFVVLGIDAARHIPEQWSFGTGDIGIPLGLYNVALPIGAALVAVHLIARLREAWLLLMGRSETAPKGDAV